MQSGCSQRLPPQGYLYRVLRENSLLIVVALIQANAVATSNVYGGDYFYYLTSLTVSLAVAPAP